MNTDYGLSTKKKYDIKFLLTMLFVFNLMINEIAFGQTLKEIKIGDQFWMSQNLDVEKFRNGDEITQAKTDEEWLKANNKKKPAWCYYEFRKVNDDPDNWQKYGKLYNWYAIHDKRGLAPSGWHIPSDDEWTILTNYLNGFQYAGEKIKSETGWKTSKNAQGNGVDEFQFKALPGGMKNVGAGFSAFSVEGVFWTATEFAKNKNFAWARTISGDSKTVNREEKLKGYGYSIRCVRD